MEEFEPTEKMDIISILISQNNNSIGSREPWCDIYWWLMAEISIFF